jgi:hypothetical protein
MNKQDFTISIKSLEVSLTILSKVPDGFTTVWDFGVVGEDKSEESTHIYETSGIYTITLYYRSNETGDLEEQLSKVAIVSEHVHTQLSDSIYNLIDKYIPSDLQLELTSADKDAYIRKWQLYIQPLVNHFIPLENQLIMELAVYDYLYTKIQTMLIQTANQLTNQVVTTTSDDSEGRDRIKQITTGPTEVQYYDTVTESISALFKSYSTATQPGGILDDIRKNLCMLAARLEIFLPICEHPRQIKVPKITNVRRAGRLGGPNPGSVVNNPKDSIIE